MSAELKDRDMSISPYATHADLSALRQEIQKDLKEAIRELSVDLRSDLTQIRSDRKISQQWLVTTLISASSTIIAVYTMMHH